MCTVEESGVNSKGAKNFRDPKINIETRVIHGRIVSTIKGDVAKDALDLVYEDAVSKDGWDAAHEDAHAPEERRLVCAVDVRRNVWEAQTGKDVSQVLDWSYGCSGGPGSVSTHAIKTIKTPPPERFYGHDASISRGTCVTESTMALGKTTLSLSDSRVELPVRTSTLTYPDSSASLMSVYSVSPTNMI